MNYDRFRHRFLTYFNDCDHSSLTNKMFTALTKYTWVSWCSHKGETYWNNRWIFTSQMSFMLLNL